MNNGLGFDCNLSTHFVLYIEYFILFIMLMAIGHCVHDYIIRHENEKRWKDGIENGVFCDYHMIEIYMNHSGLGINQS